MTNELIQKLQNDVLEILAQHEEAGYRKTGDGNYPLASLYADLTHSQRAAYYPNNKWSFVSPPTAFGKPIDGLEIVLNTIGFEVYNDETNNRVVTRVRIA